MRLRLGSMCSGYEGLGMAIADVLDVELAWVADDSPGASAILAHHYPDVQNLGDITAVDWTTVEPVDVVAVGFPCTDVSYAGLRVGLREGTRSGVWSHAALGISVLQPSIVVVKGDTTDWGDYEPAIRRWEALTRPVPSPTEPGKTGKPRLAPAFSEWMMGIPAGWVTAVPGLTRNQQLTAIGNGVVPAQAAHALRLLLAAMRAEVAA